jgi:glycine cleavage system H protein
MASPSDRVYSDSHEWHKVSPGSDTLVLGLSKFAVDQLTDVTYVEMKKPGFKFKAGDSLGEVESVKTTSEVYCAAGGEILEVNQSVVKDPSILNSDPYEKGWLVKIKITDKGGLEKCLNAAAYDKAHPGH